MPSPIYGTLRKALITRELKGITRELKGITRELKGITRELKGITRELKGIEKKIFNTFIRTSSFISPLSMIKNFIYGM